VKIGLPQRELEAAAGVAYVSSVMDGIRRVIPADYCADCRREGVLGNLVYVAFNI